MSARKTYSPKEICQMLQISARQLGYWRLIGVVKPRKKVRGSKVFHDYSEKDLKILKEVRELTAQGYFVSKAAQHVKSGLGTGRPEKKIGLQEEQGSSYIQSRFKEEWSRSRRFHHPFSCIVMWFVLPQDMASAQHQRALRQVEEIILRNKREYDVIARTTEEEFVWLLPQTDEQGALMAAERLRTALQMARRPVDEAGSLSDQMRLGIATAVHSNHEIEDLLGRARQRAQEK
jgi:diguanylate cyclase (GGDEF)-like protein